MKKSNTKLYKNRQQIKEKDLIVGIDIGSKFHSVVFQNKSGLILSIYKRIYNSRKGFDYLDKEIWKAMKKHRLLRVHIGFEPTGYYWKTLIYHLKEQGHRIHFIRTTAVKAQRELDDSSSSKTDPTDANHIASLIREGKFIDAKVQTGVYKALRDIGKLRAKVMKAKTGMINRLHMLVGMYFPESLELFWAIDSVGFWRLVKHAPFPDDVKRMSDEQLKELLSVSGTKKERVKEQLSKLREAVDNSIGLKPQSFDRYNIEHCIESLEMYHKQLREIKKTMNELLEKTKYWELMNSMPGVGMVTAATLLGELGDPKNFKDAKDMIKFCGLDPKENSSGQYQSGGKISKKGRYLMRTMIYFISMRLTYRCEDFKKYYERKLETKNMWGRRLEKKEALVAVGIKFLKVLNAMFKKNKVYQEGMVGAVQPMQLKAA